MNRKRTALRALPAVLLAALWMLQPFSAAALRISSADIDYTLDGDGRRVYIPKTYEFSELLDDPDGTLNHPQDLFIDAEDRMYIADTDNHRVLKLDQNRQLCAVYTGDGETDFNQPTGVFAAADGTLYVADYGNSRIVRLDAEGRKLREYGMPDSELLGDVYEFRPNKVCVSDGGDLYVIMGKNFMKLSADNEFLGYVGAGRVSYGFADWVRDLFLTEEQKSKIARREPVSYSNFTLGANGRLYAVAAGSTEQIRIINSVGNNIYKAGTAFGEKTEGTSGSWFIPAWLDPDFADITVDADGILTVADKNNCRLYQYDGNGNLLTVFGGRGSTRGRFQVPSAVATDSTGRIYVLDSALGCVQVFTPTGFIRSIHEALLLYENGQYTASGEKWREVEAVNGDYPLSQQCLGDIYYKAKAWPEAMKAYRTVGDTEGYIRAYGRYLHDGISEHFLWAAVGLAAGVFALGWLLLRGKRLANRYSRELFGIRSDR